ncbi:MAG: hypothetical protein AMQ22_02135 [Candidatus Methanofastidiosum methylothiophilum]|uniref:Uncharacterized protein n=1 Tax=Candidatus Methanofastidiosum methylothiophilum TaxID=1705564 RepID=A0A150IN23_9EURY|nr:MAG: hypothetical protein AMQ22_02135 [Candidatus Methanofastidiosum methylthiophilus]
MVITMRKIITLLVSLLFVGSTFGVASALSSAENIECSSCDGSAPCRCEGSSYGISMTAVKVGQTFTITHNKQESYWQWIKVDDSTRTDIWYNEVVPNGLPVRLGLVELIDFRAYYSDGSSYDYKEAPKKGIGVLDHTVYTFRAVQPGTVYFTFKCNPREGPCSCCDRVVPVKIAPSLPMLSFMKIFGFGKTD